MPDVQVVRLGRIAYDDALALQRAAAAARLAGTIPDTLLLCEHPPVITLGRSAKTGNLTATAAVLAARGVDVHEVERGGDVTFHGPGQLVGYPILDLAGYRKDLHWYLRQLEVTLIAALGRFEIPAVQRPGLTGVWTNGRKIASIGVHARGWVTWHGFALNVTTDLTYFDLMVPCGIADVEMTSIARERPDAATERATDIVAAAFGDTFGAEMVDDPVVAQPSKRTTAA
jgi:lipoate-protein ligase B